MPRKSVKRQRSRSRSGRNSVRRKSSTRKKRKSVKPSSSASRSSNGGPTRRRSRARSRARKSVSRRSSTRRASSSRRKRRKSVAPPQPPAPTPSSAPRKSSTKRKRRRKVNTGAILTFYCIDCQADKNVSNLRNLEYTHVAADTNRIKILATCGKCKGDVSRIVSPQQFEQLRRKKRIYENLDGRSTNDHLPSLKVDNPADLYSTPSGPKPGGSVRMDNENGGGSSGSESGSDSGDEDMAPSGNNPQAEAMQSFSSNRSPSPSNADDDTGLKRMEQPPDLKELGSSSYNFKCV